VAVDGVDEGESSAEGFQLAMDVVRGFCFSFSGGVESEIGEAKEFGSCEQNIQ